MSALHSQCKCKFLLYFSSSSPPWPSLYSYNTSQWIFSKWCIACWLKWFSLKICDFLRQSGCDLAPIECNFNVRFCPWMSRISQGNFELFKDNSYMVAALLISLPKPVRNAQSQTYYRILVFWLSELNFTWTLNFEQQWYITILSCIRLNSPIHFYPEIAWLCIL